jgi:hypothetical protein
MQVILNCDTLDLMKRQRNTIFSCCRKKLPAAINRQSMHTHPLLPYTALPCHPFYRIPLPRLVCAFGITLAIAQKLWLQQASNAKAPA